MDAVGSALEENPALSKADRIAVRVARDVARSRCCRRRTSRRPAPYLFDARCGGHRTGRCHNGGLFASRRGPKDGSGERNATWNEAMLVGLALETIPEVGMGKRDELQRAL